jgi:hypothetical protein
MPKAGKGHCFRFAGTAGALPPSWPAGATDTSAAGWVSSAAAFSHLPGFTCATKPQRSPRRPLLVGCGLAFLLLAQNDPLGSARRMGPAHFPSLLAPLRIGIGAATTLGGSRPRARFDRQVCRRGARPYHLDRAHVWSVVSAPVLPSPRPSWCRCRAPQASAFTPLKPCYCSWRWRLFAPSCSGWLWVYRFRSSALGCETATPMRGDPSQSRHRRRHGFVGGQPRLVLAWSFIGNAVGVLLGLGPVSTSVASAAAATINASGGQSNRRAMQQEGNCRPSPARYAMAPRHRRQSLRAKFARTGHDRHAQDLH